MVVARGGHGVRAHALFAPRWAALSRAADWCCCGRRGACVRARRRAESGRSAAHSWGASQRDGGRTGTGLIPAHLAICRLCRDTRVITTQHTAALPRTTGALPIGTRCCAATVDASCHGVMMDACNRCQICRTRSTSAICNPSQMSLRHLSFSDGTHASCTCRAFAEAARDLHMHDLQAVAPSISMARAPRCPSDAACSAACAT